MEQQNVFRLDLSGYDLTSLTDTQIKELIQKVNDEATRILKESQTQFYTAYQNEADKAYAEVDSVKQEISSLTETLSAGVEQVQTVEEGFQKLIYVNGACLVGIGLLVGLGVAFFFSSFMRGR